MVAKATQLFQSHIGAIRIHNDFTLDWGEHEFQSHIGAIRIKAAYAAANVFFVFQSHIGAIRINFTQHALTPEQIFQSHIGAIRMCLSSRSLFNNFYFNPTLVQLEYENENKVSSVGLISIPHWCN